MKEHKNRWVKITVALLLIFGLLSWLLQRTPESPSDSMGLCAKWESAKECATYWGGRFRAALWDSPPVTVARTQNERTAPAVKPTRKLRVSAAVNKVSQPPHQDKERVCVNLPDREVCGSKSDRRVRVMAKDISRMKDRAVLGAGALINVLYVFDPCPLDLAGRDNMRRAWQTPGALGCWFQTTDGGFTFIAEGGWSSHSEQFVESMAPGWMHVDHTVTIDAPGYDYNSAFFAVLEAKQRAWRDSLNRQP